MRKTISHHVQDIAQGKRFSFGKNWESFLNTVSEERIKHAEESLQKMLEIGNLAGKSFLDVGCGSGLFSLAARRLGAKVFSFDYDPQSVACAEELKRRYYPNDSAWQIAEGSILDEAYVKSLGRFDVVYSWGVLHHTGDLNGALENAAIPVKPQGLLFVAVYNDQDILSKFWTKVKKTYCANWIGKWLITSIFVPMLFVQWLLIGLVKHKNPFGHFVDYKTKRGMSAYHDWLDWLGGYPYEVAKPEEIVLIYRDAGFQLVNLITTNRHGCNQFVFRRTTSTVSPKT